MILQPAHQNKILSLCFSATIHRYVRCFIRITSTFLQSVSLCLYECVCVSVTHCNVSFCRGLFEEKSGRQAHLRRFNRQGLHLRRLRDVSGVEASGSFSTVSMLSVPASAYVTCQGTSAKKSHDDVSVLSVLQGSSGKRNN